MYHIVLIAILFTISLAMWNLVHASPRSLALFLSAKVAFIIGTFFLLFGVFFAYISAYPLQNGEAMVAFFLKAHVGLWFLLAHLKGDEEMVRRSFLMMGTLLLTIVGIYYVQESRAIALLTLVMVTGGYWVTMGNPRFLNRGR